MSAHLDLCHSGVPLLLFFDSVVCCPLADLDLAAAAAVGEGLDTARELVAQSEETTAALGVLS